MSEEKKETALVPAVPVAGSLLRRELSLVESFWAGRSPKTVKAYRENLLRIAAWRGLDDIESFAEVFLAGGAGEAFKLAHEFKGWARSEKEWSPSYINNHLAALRSLVRFARRLERIEWALDVEDVPLKAYRDTRGPGLDGVALMLNAAAAQEDPWTAARDLAILALFATMGLRLFEAVGLDLEHLDAPGKRLLVLSKKQFERQWITLPTETVDALEDWVALRGEAPGPLFVSNSFGRQRDDGRLAESSVWRIVRDIGESVGLKVWPHALRHAAITEVLRHSSGNIRAAQLFARHSDPKVTMIYDDNRTDVAGEMAGMLSRAVAKARSTRKDTAK